MRACDIKTDAYGVFHTLLWVIGVTNYFVLFSLVLDYGADYSFVYEETASVTEWFTLGLYLNILLTKLDIINADYRFQTEHARREMLAVWLKSGNATFSSLCHALIKMGMRTLGNNIANRRGW